MSSNYESKTIILNSQKTNKIDRFGDSIILTLKLNSEECLESFIECIEDILTREGFLHTIVDWCYLLLCKMLLYLYPGILTQIQILSVIMVINKTAEVASWSLFNYAISSTEKPDSDVYGKSFVFSTDQAVCKPENVCSDGKQIQIWW